MYIHSKITNININNQINRIYKHKTEELIIANQN